MTRVIKIENISGVTKNYQGQDILNNEIFTIQESEISKWSNDLALLYDILSDLVKVHDEYGVITDKTNAINYLKGVNTSPKNTDGRAVIHSTARPLGTMTYFTSSSDSGCADDTNYNGVGGDVPEQQKLKFHHKIGQDLIQIKYLDLNCIINDTYVHEAYVQWKDAIHDEAVVEIVPKVTAVSAGVNTNFNLYGGYLIIPALGNGTITVNPADMRLVQMVPNEFGQIEPGYWDATYNANTGQFENIVPNITGTGKYNMFAAEVVLQRFGNRIPFLGNAVQQINTNDASQLGHNMRIKATALTYTSVDVLDHDWFFAVILTLYRKRTA